jgi:uncharacterized protein YdgA (DUF945 family)
MLAALLLVALLVAGGGGDAASWQQFIDQQNASVEDVIKERDRRKEILSFVDEMETELKRFSEQQEQLSGAILKLNRDYGATRSNFEKTLDDMNDNRAMTQQTILEARFKMKSKMSREEWEVIFKR